MSETLLVAERRCDRCLLGRNPLVSPERVEELLEDCNRSGRAFECHRFTMVGQRGTCRAFFDGNMSLVVRLARMLDVVEFVPLPPKQRDIDG